MRRTTLLCGLATWLASGLALAQHGPIEIDTTTTSAAGVVTTQQLWIDGSGASPKYQMNYQSPKGNGGVIFDGTNEFLLDVAKSKYMEINVAQTTAAMAAMPAAVRAKVDGPMGAQLNVAVPTSPPSFTAIPPAGPTTFAGYNCSYFSEASVAGGATVCLAPWGNPVPQPAIEDLAKIVTKLAGVYNDASAGTKLYSDIAACTQGYPLYRKATNGEVRQVTKVSASLPPNNFAPPSGYTPMGH